MRETVFDFLLVAGDLFLTFHFVVIAIRNSQLFEVAHQTIKEWLPIKL